MHTWGHHRVKIPSGGAVFHCLVFVQLICSLLWEDLRRDPFNQTFRKFRSKTQWIGSVQPEKFQKNGSNFSGGPLFPVRPVGILVGWIAPLIFMSPLIRMT